MLKLICRNYTYIHCNIKGTDKKLAILLEGESLLNDGAALVFFTVFLQFARGEYEGRDGMFSLIIVIHLLFFGCFTCTLDSFELVYWSTWHSSWSWISIVEWRHFIM